ncbi:AraC family transcriptional regulator [Grimontia kaedaensis]|uniref:AraC family transcriptional regulator n=1 Tax=Grimontia kaedaensis TaxID=2872157 RepID=A0ABY4WS76_9GAMM|nr:AraC family transcriptional regulator [Grimontia kaedaensis]USH01191.1 AraC family transcriptional regulator [Grimontia kaedaensis]
MSVEYSALSGFLIPVIMSMKKFEIDVEPTLSRFGLSESEANNPEGRLSVERLGNLFLYCNEKAGGRAFGLDVAQNFHLSTLHIFGYAIQSSYSLKDGLEHFAKYRRVLSNSTQIHTRIDGAKLFIEFDVERYKDSSRLALTPQLIEALFIGVICQSREMMSGYIGPVDIEFSFEPFPESCPAVDEFFVSEDCTVNYQCEKNAIVFDLQLASLQSPGSNPLMNMVHTKLLNTFMERFDRSNITYLVENKIAEELKYGNPSQSKIAEELGYSLRKLQRRLREQGTSFKDILEETRKNLAKAYVRQPQYTISEVGHMVGFSDVANFNRAFRRWENCSPSEYRERYLSTGRLTA